VRLDGPVAAIRDLGSRNGVFVNGERRDDAPLLPGDVLRCGEWIAVVSHDGERDSFHAIAPGWLGGAALASAVLPAQRLPPDLPVILHGETGTGKEGAARAIHAWSGRQGPFLAVNCAALPSHLVEAELFGHKRGAFTGADKASPGLFRAAHGGTLFLDEILELPKDIQPKLLRVLEQHEVLPLGETRPVSVDARIVCATQESLVDAVADRRFRADLLARLDGYTVAIPPLRARREDVVPLFLAFLREHAGGRPPAIEPRLAEALALYDWPLNVRELLLLTRRLLGLFGTEATLKKSHLPARVLARAPEPADKTRSDSQAAPPPKRAWRRTNDDAEFDALVDALREHRGNVARAAVAVGISRARAYRLIAARPDFSIDGVR
jgi:transcriptional regulator with PAS, ATPase and Fis domain